jgi:flagellar protein FliS
MSITAPGNQYLESTVLSATPARLRLMLLERSIETAAKLEASWKTKETTGPNEHSVKLLDLITELLAGVRGGESKDEKDICDRVSDLYVFLAKHLVAAEQFSDHGAIGEIKLVLEAESDTWRAVCAQDAALCAQDSGAAAESTSLPPSTSLNLQG